jgi:hypothetical protein
MLSGLTFRAILVLHWCQFVEEVNAMLVGPIQPGWRRIALLVWYYPVR